MSYREYEKKLLSCDEAAGLVKSGDWVDFCQVGAFPKGMDEALARRKDELTDIKIRNAITLSPVACLEADLKNDVFTYNLWLGKNHHEYGGFQSLRQHRFNSYTLQNP